LSSKSLLEHVKIRKAIKSMIEYNKNYHKYNKSNTQTHIMQYTITFIQFIKNQWFTASFINTIILLQVIKTMGNQVFS
jgi:hypothetical protein